MKKLIIAGVISLFATTAFALHENVGDSSEFYGSTLTEHGAGSPQTNEVSATHDHGDDTIYNFVEHDHDGKIVAEPVGRNGKNRIDPLHDHGDDTINNFVEHQHN